MIITHPLPLSGLTCLSTRIATSLAVPWDSFSFSSDCSDRVLKRQKGGEGIEASICIVFVRFLFLSPWILSRKSQRWRCSKMNREPHIKISWKSNGSQNLDCSFTGMVLSFCGKRKGYDVKCISLRSNMISKFPTVRLIVIERRTMCLNFMTIQW